MKFFRRIASVLGIVRDDPTGGEDEDDRAAAAAAAAADEDGHRPLKRGLSVQVPGNAERASVGPVIVPCNLGEGGVQGFKWYGRRLRMDEDGDVADGFLTEVTAEPCSRSNSAPSRVFEVQRHTQPAPVGIQAMAVNGNIHQSMEYQGKLTWV